MLGALAVVAAALALFVWLKPPKTQGPAIALSSSKSAEAKSIKVEREGKPLATLQKQGALWQLTAPLKAPADDFQVARLLAVLEAKSAASYAPDLAKFELEAPRAVLEIDGERYVFGAVNTVTREQYVLTRGTVYAVDARFGAAVPAAAAALARRTLFAPGDAPVKFEMGAFSIAQDAMKWTITPATELSQDNTNRWVAQWREGSALRAEPADAQPAQRELAFTLKDGTRVAVGVVASDPELVLRRADIGLQFVYAGDIGRQMLAPPPLQK